MKEIIIDGVNVAECVFLNKANGFKHCYCTNEKDTLGDERNTRYGGCEYNNDCYYKQLKRLEKENEKLKEIIETQNPWNKCKNCNKDYKSVLEEIREIEKNAYYSNNLVPMSQMQLMENIIDGYEQRRCKILNKINEVLKCE